MVAGLVGGLLGGAGSIVSGLLGSSASKQSTQAFRDATQQNADVALRSLYLTLQQDEIRRRMEQRNFDQVMAANNKFSDPLWQMRRKEQFAKESGIHVLAALGTGAGGGYGAPQATGGGGISGVGAPGGGGGGGGDGGGAAIGDGISKIGETIENAIERRDEKEKAETNKIKAEADLVKAQSRTLVKKVENQTRGSTPSQHIPTDRMGYNMFKEKDRYFVRYGGNVHQVHTDPKSGEPLFVGDFPVVVDPGTSAAGPLADTGGEGMENLATINTMGYGARVQSGVGMPTSYLNRSGKPHFQMKAKHADPVAQKIIRREARRHDAMRRTNMSRPKFKDKPSLELSVEKKIRKPKRRR